MTSCDVMTSFYDICDVMTSLYDVMWCHDITLWRHVTLWCHSMTSYDVTHLTLDYLHPTCENLTCHHNNTLWSHYVTLCRHVTSWRHSMTSWYHSMTSWPDIWGRYVKWFGLESDNRQAYTQTGPNLLPEPLMLEVIIVKEWTLLQEYDMIS